MPRPRCPHCSLPTMCGAACCSEISPPIATRRVTCGIAGSTKRPRSCSSPWCSSLSSNRSEQFFASCPRGLEELLVRELGDLGIAASAVPGGVAFADGWDACYRANLWSRLASRILWRVGEFAYGDEKNIYEAARSLDWTRQFGVERTLRVNVSAQKSPLKSLDFATLRI